MLEDLEVGDRFVHAHCNPTARIVTVMKSKHVVLGFDGWDVALGWIWYPSMGSSVLCCDIAGAGSGDAVICKECCKWQRINGRE